MSFCMDTNLHYVKAVKTKETNWAGTRWTQKITIELENGDEVSWTLFSANRIAVEKLQGDVED